MIGTLKLVGIAVVAVAVAYGGGRLQGYLSGKEQGRLGAFQEVRNKTAELNEKLRELETLEADAMTAAERELSKVMHNKGKLPYFVTEDDWKARQK